MLILFLFTKQTIDLFNIFILILVISLVLLHNAKLAYATNDWTTNSLWVDQYLCSITSCFEFPFNPRCSDYRFYIEIRMGLSKIRWRNWISGLEAWCRLCNRSHPPNCVFFCSGNVSENVRLDERVFLIIRYANFLNWKTPVINDWWCLREDYGWV